MANDYLVNCVNCGKQVSLTRDQKDPACMWCGKPALRKESAPPLIQNSSPPAVHGIVGRGPDKKPRRVVHSHWDQKKDEIIGDYILDKARHVIIWTWKKKKARNGNQHLDEHGLIQKNPVSGIISRHGLLLVLSWRC